jgi:hypothetical protein
MHLPDPVSQTGVGVRLDGSAGRGGLPMAEAGPGHAQDPAQPLHSVACLVIVDELEAVHQRVSPAKYRAALRRMSRSSSNSRTRLRNAAFSACTEPAAAPTPPVLARRAAALLISAAHPAPQRFPVDPEIVGDLRDRRARP